MKKISLSRIGAGRTTLVTVAVALAVAGALVSALALSPSPSPFVSETFAAKQAGQISGIVSNTLTGNPVEGVYVEIAVALPIKAISYAVTGADGRYAFSGLPDSEGFFDITFVKLEYFPDTLPAVAAGRADADVDFRPLGVTTPRAPIANAAPSAAYIEWEANPEFNIKGYRIWRMETDADGNPSATATGLDEQDNDVGSAERVTAQEGIGPVVEYLDETAATGVFYVYQVQAISAAGRLSDLSPPSSPPVKGEFVTVFFPEVIEVVNNKEGLYLGDFSLEDVAALQQWVRIPISARSAYEVGVTSMDIVVKVPSHLLQVDSLDDQVEVRPTGITEGMLFLHNVGTDILYPGGSTGSPGDIRISAVSLEVEDRVLYGSGAIFEIYAKIKPNVEGSGPLTVVEDQFPLGPDGVRLYDIGGAVDGMSLNIEVESGTLIVSNLGCLHGDVDLSGSIDADDVQRILDISTRAALPDATCPEAGDINLDGRINSADASQLQRWLEQLPLNPAATGIKSLAERKTVSFAAFDKQVDPKPTVSIGTASGRPGEDVTVAVTIAGSAPSAGFSMAVTYLAGPGGLTFKGVALGDTLGLLGYAISYNDTVLGENNDSGSTVIAVGGPESITTKAEVILVNLTFTIGSDAPPFTGLDLALSSFESNDQYAHTPRHGAPGQASIQKGIIPPTIAGVVTSGQTGQPIAQATVTLSPGASSTKSNESGLYVFSPVADGNYTVSVVASSYDGQSKAANVSSSRATKSISFELTGGGEGSGGEGGGGGGGGGGCASSPQMTAVPGSMTAQPYGDLLLLVIVLAATLRCGRRRHTSPPA